MDRREEYRDDMSSPRSHTDRQWSPPPQFQENDQTYAAQASSQTYSNPNSPPAVSPQLNDFEQPEYHQQPQPQHHEAYQEGYSTEKETPYATREALGSPTPDYSGPQVVPGQFTHYPHGGRPMSPSSQGGTTLMSPQLRPYGFKEHVDPSDGPESYRPPVPPKDDRKCGMKKRTFFILIGCVVIWILALALGLGLGLGLGLKKKSSAETMDPFCRTKPELCIGGTLNADYFSKKGAFNGTGIALAGESWNKGQRRIFTLYFQHHTGDIRFMQYSTDRKWDGGTKAQTVASDAKNASPISAVAFAVNHTQYFHIFYVDTNNTIKQVTLSNATNIWEPGPLSDLNLKAFDSPSIGLQACWKGNYYGDSDFTKFPTASGLNNTQPFADIQGMNIWFAIDDSTFQQYAWYDGQDIWVPIQKWSGFNGHAGVGCYSWGEGTTTYAMMSNKDNDVEFWWKDTNTTTVSEVDHPINSWQNATDATIRDVYPSSSFGYTSYFYAQMADKSFKGYNVTYQAENTTFVEDSTFSITNPVGPVTGLGGTHLSVTSFAEKDSSLKTLWDSLYVFFQTEGDDITAFTRPMAGGEWSQGSLDIPDE
ncbi:hypothetical protein EJ02DRAFT_461571 [Clathrospora elynae]|uniref:Fucose-specific lectin n=1 Tax=Clathrospora elynae TaxID=706981 RepID=A0A6A5T8M3_9PLEO|nr:hypothetical protein EJ02DRAFT_461571 [Clathrospora elynae]